MRRQFEKSLDILHKEMILMGNMVAGAISQSVRALINKDETLARDVVESDSKINAKENELEAICMSLLLREQPVASDLRFVTSALKMLTDLERIGDQAADISALNIKLNRRSYKSEDLGSLVEMAKITISMVNDAMKAYVNADVDLILEVLDRDDEVDSYFTKVREEVIEDIKSDLVDTKNSLDMFMIAKYLERIGDHASNIARRVYYSLTGEYKFKD
ncbi:phosphate signaling complex protein PhoU [Peptoniphilaceae bacterium SGI.131]